MPTLAQLWRAVFPAARPYGDGERPLQRQVAWVRLLKARVPAFDALEPDDLAVLPGSTLASLADLAVEPASVVEAVARARGSGVLVVGDAVGEGQPAQAVLERSAALDLAAFALPEADVSTLERSILAYIINGQAELERRAAGLEAELEKAALAGGGPQGLAATIARFLARPVAIEGPDGTPLAIHAPVGATAGAPGVTEYLKRRRGAALRLALPAAGGDVGRRGRSSGALLLLGPEPVSELERVATARVTAFLALELGRGRPARGGADRGPEALPADGPPWVALVARQLDESQPTTPDERERRRDELRRLEPVRRLALRGDAASVELRLVAATGPHDPRGHRLAGRVARLLDRPVAVSRPFSEAAERPVMEAQARATLEALEQLPAAEQARLAGPDGAIVGATELLPAFRLLGALSALPDAQRQARSLLQPLLSGRPQRDAEALATLRAVLDHPAVAEAAATLGVHRNTLAYRLQRIEQRTGWQLADPVLRFALAIALRLMPNAQMTPAENREPPDDTGRTGG